MQSGERERKKINLDNASSYHIHMHEHVRVQKYTLSLPLHGTDAVHRRSSDLLPVHCIHHEIPVLLRSPCGLGSASGHNLAAIRADVINN